MHLSSSEIQSLAVRLADAKYVLEWVLQQGVDTVPANIHDLAARALDVPSLAQGYADETLENCHWDAHAMRWVRNPLSHQDLP